MKYLSFHHTFLGSTITDISTYSYTELVMFRVWRFLLLEILPWSYGRPLRRRVEVLLKRTRELWPLLCIVNF
jgi:hypothetical protein